MLDTIEKLLILQDRDRNLLRTRAELEAIEPEKQMARHKQAGVQKELEEAKHRVMEIEARRKELELEAQAETQKADKYSTQQLQTKKNEEYKALANEIEGCKNRVSAIEDKILVAMEEADAAKQVLKQATAAAAAVQKTVDLQVADLDERKKNLEVRLTELDGGRAELAAAVEPEALAKYERLLKQRGEKVIVGIAHGVCGGCHMKLTAQSIVECKTQETVAFCPHCGRIIYYSREMDMTVA